MMHDEQLEAPEIEKDKDDLDEKIDRLQKQNEAESIALMKLLNGLDKIEKAKIINRNFKTDSTNSKLKI